MGIPGREVIAAMSAETAMAVTPQRGRAGSPMSKVKLAYDNKDHGAR